MHVCVCVCLGKIVLLNVWDDEVRPGAFRAALPHLQASSHGSSLLADPHLLGVGPRFSLHVSVVMLETVIFYVWKTQKLKKTHRECDIRDKRH